MTSFSFGRIDFSMWGISSKILLTCTPSMIERSSTVSGSFLRISIISCLLVIKAGFNIKVEVLWAMPVLDIREKPSFAEKNSVSKM